MGSIPSMAILNFLLIATGTISQICAALPSTWQLPTAASPAPPLLWKFKTGQSIENAVSVGNGIVYAGSDDYSVYALNATTGEKIWQDDEYSTTSQSMMTPTVADGIVYFSVTGTLYAADSMNGTVLWKYRVNQVWHNQTINDYSSTTSPAIKDNIVYVGSGSYLSALHAKTGELKWIILVGPHVFQDTIASAPTVAEGIVHFAANEACTPKPSGSFRHLTECPVQQFQMESCTLGHGMSSCMHWMPRPEHCSGSMKLAVTLPAQLLRMEWFTLDLGMATYTQLMPRLEQSVGPLLSPRVIVYAQVLWLIRGLCILVPPTTIFMR